jgi:ATP-dependent helicase/DNAse subunit B
LYAQLYDELSCGNIAKDCVEGACEYCDYKAICQFKGEAKKERNRTSIASLNEGAQNEAES